MASYSITSTLQYWLVNHPQILNFTWTPNQTLASSPHFLILSILTYLSLTFILYHASTSTSPPSPPLIGPHILKPITAVHNLTLLLLSLIMAVGCTLSIILHLPHLRYTLCFPPYHFSVWPSLLLSPLTISPSRPLFFYAYIFYLSKILEFFDTLLIILSNSIQRLTFLHVYHHATVVVMCFLWLQTKQSLFPIALVTNASVHVVMYEYYLLCVMGLRPKWKRLVTDCQIVQFVFGFVVSVLMLYYHFTGFGCSGIWGWCFNAVFNASLLALFFNFYSKSYAKKKKQG